MTLVSRVLGLARDAVIAGVYGASAATDAFFVAFKIPNLFRRLFAEGAFSQAFVPVLAGYKAERSPAQVRELVDAVCGALGAVLLVITAAGVIAAPVFITLVAPGFLVDGPRFDLSVDLLRLTFPYLFFISLTAFLGAVLNTWGRFAIPALTPALLNLSFIGAALWLAPRLGEPVLALAVGVLVGGALQLGLQIVATWRAGLLPRPRLRRRHPGVKRILGLMLPGIFGVSVAQLNFLVDTLIASFLREGSISWLYFADRLMEFPLGIFGVALGTVILPRLSEHHSLQETEAFSRTLDWGMRMVLLITLPAAVGLTVLSGPILSTLFEYGRMSHFDVLMSSRALVAYAFGLTGFILVKVLAPGYFSRQDTRTPVRIGVIALLTNLALNLLFVGWLQHAGLALATSIAAFVNAGLLLRGLRLKGIYHPTAGWRIFMLRLAGAAGIMGLALHFASPPLETWSVWTLAARLSYLALLVGGGMALFGLLCLTIGLRPAHMAQPGRPL